MSHHFDPFRSASTGWIFHCDADAFYASCHMAENQELAGHPLVVAGDPKARHGIIVTASYPARKCGIRTGMRLDDAWDLCPDLVAIKPDKELYRRYSAAMHDVFVRNSQIVEPLSLDEAWLDMSPYLSFTMDPLPVAQELQAAVARDVGISVSIGISVNKMLAKQVSDWSKPHGITLLRVQELPARLWPRPVSDLFGCGPSSVQKLAAMGVGSIGQLAALPLPEVLERFGQHGLALYMRARGEDNTPVTVPRPEDRRSVSAEHTTERDIVDHEDAGALLRQCASEVSHRLQSLCMVGYRIAIKWRTREFVTFGRQMRVTEPLIQAEDIYRAARMLWNQRGEVRPVRLLGITVSALDGLPRQLHFWP